MVRFLDSDGIRSELSNILKKSKDHIYLISPYLQIRDRYRTIIQDVAKQGTSISIVYGKKDLREDEFNWIDSIENIEIHYYEPLHAKCYMNEKTALITSMNLYKHSMDNNYEMGILVERDNDSETYHDIEEEIRRLLRVSTIVKVSTSTNKKDDLSFIYRNKNEMNEEDPRLCHCIRCGCPIYMDMEKPYCDKDFKTWKRYGNPDYIEKNGHCLACGKDAQVSMNDPFCPECKPRKSLVKRILN